jgi:hypothetical protein
MDRRRRVRHHFGFDAWDSVDLAHALLKAEQRRAPWVYQEIAWVGEDWVDKAGVRRQYHHLVLWMVQRVDPSSREAVRLELADVAVATGGTYSGCSDTWPHRRPQRQRARSRAGRWAGR